MARKRKETPEQTAARKKVDRDREYDRKKKTQVQPVKKVKEKPKEPISLGPPIHLEPKKERGIISKGLETAGKIIAGKDIEIRGRTIKTGVGDTIDPKTGEPIKVVAGTLPIGPGGFLGAGAGAAKGIDAITKASIKAGNLQQIKALSGGVETIAVNSKTLASTTSWLTKLAEGFKNPTVIASGLIAAIGSYPFAGFIKEEALQTLSFGVKSAISNNDLESAQLALDEQNELLNPGLWDSIISKIPFANVVNSLSDFYSSATTKVAIDQKVISDLKTQQETGESETDKWKRIREEEAAQDKASVDYYNDQRKQMLEWEAEAKRNQRNADAEFWRKEREAQMQKEKEDREAIAKFWQAYRKEMQKLADNSRPSNLNFGLI